MPRILITGLPRTTADSSALERLLMVDIPSAVENTAGFHIASENVIAHLVPDVIERPALTVRFTIEGVIKKPDRTSEMRQNLSKAVADVIARYLTAAQLPYKSIVGWSTQIDLEDDGFVRRLG